MSGFFCVLSPPPFFKPTPTAPLQIPLHSQGLCPCGPIGVTHTGGDVPALYLSIYPSIYLSLSYLCIDSLTPLSLPRDTSIWPWAIRVITGLPPLATTSHMSARLLVGFNTATLTPPTLVSARSIPLSCARLSSFSWFFCFCNTHAHAHAHTHTHVV